MATPTDPGVIALVFGTGDSYTVCVTPDELVAAAQAVLDEGGSPIVFHRTGHHRPDVVNISHGGTGGIQARDIHGGVNLR